MPDKIVPIVPVEVRPEKTQPQINEPRYKIYKNLANGQLAGTTSAAEADLYLCPAAHNAIVLSMSFINTHSSAVTITVYFKKSGGTSRMILPSALSVAIGAAYKDDYVVTLGPGDAIRGWASVAAKIDYVISGEEHRQGSGRR
jgi:hypothetical protein